MVGHLYLIIYFLKTYPNYIDCPGGGGCTVFNNTFEGNGGLTFTNGLASKNVFVNESAGNYIFRLTGGEVYNNIFLQNTAEDSGALQVYADSNIHHNTFINNLADDGSDGFGGGIKLMLNSDTMIIEYNHFDSNKAEKGGGIYIWDYTSNYSAQIRYNNMLNNLLTGAGTLQNLYIEEDAQQDCTFNYWGGELVDPGLMGIVYEGIAPDVSGAVATPYPLCVDEPTNPDCVGADFEYIP